MVNILCVCRCSQRTDWRQERKLNSETFGVSSARRGYRGGRGGYYRGGGGQGYRGNYNNRGGGYRGHRGGYNNQRNQQQQPGQPQQQQQQSQAAGAPRGAPQFWVCIAGFWLAGLCCREDAQLMLEHDDHYLEFDCYHFYYYYFPPKSARDEAASETSSYLFFWNGIELPYKTIIYTWLNSDFLLTWISYFAKPVLQYILICRVKMMCFKSRDRVQK
jgi:hypothetical protein